MVFDRRDRRGVEVCSVAIADRRRGDGARVGCGREPQAREGEREMPARDASYEREMQARGARREL